MQSMVPSSRNLTFKGLSTTPLSDRWETGYLVGTSQANFSEMLFGNCAEKKRETEDVQATSRYAGHYERWRSSRCRSAPSRSRA